MPNTEGRWRSFISIWAGSPPQKVFDILQRDVSEEAFYDKPSWGDPESDACNAPLSQPACSFSHLFFQLGWGFLLSLCVLHSPFARERERDQRVHFVLCVKYMALCEEIFRQLRPRNPKSEKFFGLAHRSRNVQCAVWEGFIWTFRAFTRVIEVKHYKQLKTEWELGCAKQQFGSAGKPL